MNGGSRDDPTLGNMGYSIREETTLRVRENPRHSVETWEKLPDKVTASLICHTEV